MYTEANRKYWAWNHVVVTHDIRICWLKCDKWRLAKNVGSLWWFSHGFKFDPSTHAVMVCGQQKEAFWSLLRAVLEKAVPMPRKLHLVLKFWWTKMFVNFGLFPLNFDQGRRSAVQGPLVIYMIINCRCLYFWYQWLMPNCDNWLCHNPQQKLWVDFDRGFFEKVTIRCEIIVDLALMRSSPKPLVANVLRNRFFSFSKGVLEPSEGSLDAFSKKTVSNQAKPPAQHFVHLPLALDWMGSRRQ